MPRLKIGDREYGLGQDVEDTLALDPLGWGPREAPVGELAKLLSMLAAFGFAPTPRSSVVYEIHGNGRRPITVAGLPLQVYAEPVYVPAAPEQPQPAADVDITFPADPIPGVDVPVELVPVEDEAPIVPQAPFADGAEKPEGV